MLSNIKYIYKQLIQYDKKIIFLQIAEIITRVIAPFAGMILPAFIIYMVERQYPLEEIIPLVLIAFAVYALFSCAKDYLVQSAPMRYIEFRMRALIPKFFTKCTEIDYDKFESEDVQQSATQGYSAVMENGNGADDLIMSTTSFFENLFGITLYTVFVAAINPLLILVFFGTSVIQYVVYLLVIKYVRKQWGHKGAAMQTLRYLNTRSYDPVSGKDIRIFSLSHWIFSKYRISVDTVCKYEFKNRLAFFGSDQVGVVAQITRDIFCYVYLFALLANGLTAAEFVILIGAVAGFSVWFTGLANAIMFSQNSSFMFSMYRKFLDIENEKTEGTVLADSKTGYQVVFENVSFQYPSAKKEVLKNLNFSINSKEKVALVGINGAGKTTLIKLLCGFYKPSAGRILVDGVDITTLNKEKYQERISAVFQDAFLPHVTLEENVTCQIHEGETGNEARSAVEDALKQGGIYEKIASLKLREKTYLGKEMSGEGVEFSGGEEQKLVFARAVYRESNLLVLDEPTAALDAIAEQEMYEKYANFSQNNTSIFISHRLASTRFCDKIFLLDGGVIAEQGTHEELLDARQGYFEMFEAQRKHYVEEVEEYA